MLQNHQLKYAILIGMISSFFFVPGLREFSATSLSFLHARDFYGLRFYLLSFGAATPLLSILLMVIQSVFPFVPGIVMTITNAWLFGWAMGSLYTCVGALLGATLDFFIARWYGRPLFGKLMHGKFAAMLDRYVRRHGAVAVLISRLVPIVPFKIVSYSAGFSNMPPRLFALVTLLGQIPGIVLYSILGEHILKNGYAILIATAVLMLIALLVFKCRFFFIRIIKKMARET